jgi:hypothetical protein
MKNATTKTLIREQYLFGEKYSRTCGKMHRIDFVVEVLRTDTDTWETFTYVNGKQTALGTIGSKADCVRDAKKYLNSRIN